MPVVVTLRAAHRQPEERGRDDLDRVRHHRVARCFLIGRERRPVRCHAQKTRRRDQFHRVRGKILQRRFHQFITGELLADELVERLVRVERTNHVIAIPIGVLAFRVPVIVALRIRVARHVQPVPSPPLAVMRRLQQPLDHALECTGCGVGHKRIDLFRRRRQARQIKRRAAEQCHLVRLGRKPQPARPQLRQQERIHRCAHRVSRRSPGRQHRHRRSPQRLKRPKFPLFLREIRPLPQRLRLGPRRPRARRHPSSQRLHLRR